MSNKTNTWIVTELDIQDNRTKGWVVNKLFDSEVKAKSYFAQRRLEAMRFMDRKPWREILTDDKDHLSIRSEAGEDLHTIELHLQELKEEA